VGALLLAGGHIQMIMQGRHAAKGGKVEGAGATEAARREAQKRDLIYGFDITSAYPSKQYKLPAMALPIEWKLKKGGSLGKVEEKIEGKWVWREGGELTEDIIKTMSFYSMIAVAFSFPEKCFDVTTKKLRDTPWYPLFYRCKDGSILFPAKGIGRYYRGEILQAFDWVRRMRSDMNETQQARMIKLHGAWEFICPTVNDLTPAQLEAIKTNCPSARIGDNGLIYPFQYIKDY
jgi:hypothetical protein